MELEDWCLDILNKYSDSSGYTSLPCSSYLEVPINLLHRDINQVRTEFSKAELKELAESIKDTKQQADIVVYPSNIGGQNHLAIKEGERRFRALHMLSRESAKVKVEWSYRVDNKTQYWSNIRDQLHINSYRVDVSLQDIYNKVASYIKDMDCTFSEAAEYFSYKKSKITRLFSFFGCNSEIIKHCYPSVSQDLRGLYDLSVFYGEKPIAAEALARDLQMETENGGRVNLRERVKTARKLAAGNATLTTSELVLDEIDLSSTSFEIDDDSNGKINEEGEVKQERPIRKSSKIASNTNGRITEQIELFSDNLINDNGRTFITCDYSGKELKIELTEDLVKKIVKQMSDDSL